MSLKIYCVHPISGWSADDVFAYYTKTEKTLMDAGYTVYHPMFGKDFLRTELKFKSADYRHPITCNHSIFGRDKWMCMQADIIYASFIGTKIVSIGSMFELAWGSFNHKHVIVAMEPDNIHRHAFVMEAATTIFESEDEALTYLTKLSNKQI